jgi:valyl-tRNA synthetase
MKIMKTSSAFCNKIWQASRFYFQALDRLQTDPAKLEAFNRFSVLPSNDQIDYIIKSTK